MTPHAMTPTVVKKRLYGPLAFVNAQPGCRAYAKLLPTTEPISALVIAGQLPQHVDSVSVRVNGFEVCSAYAWRDDDGVMLSGGQAMNNITRQTIDLDMLRMRDVIVCLLAVPGSRTPIKGLSFSPACYAEASISLADGATPGATITAFGWGGD